MSYDWDFPGAMQWMDVGDSFFVPCLACESLRREIQTTADKLRIKVVIKFVIENEIQGLRTVRIRA